MNKNDILNSKPFVLLLKCPKQWKELTGYYKHPEVSCEEPPKNLKNEFYTEVERLAKGRVSLQNEENCMFSHLW